MSGVSSGQPYRDGGVVFVTEVMVTCHVSLAMVLLMGQVIMIGDNPGLMKGSEVT